MTGSRGKPVATELREAGRREALTAIAYPPDLPITAKAGVIAAAIRDHPVVIVCGETGSGKTTQLPKIALAAGRGQGGLIGHTQPRRIAARATATRIAQELKTELGGTVGYKVRFTERVSPRCCVKLMTDGILLAETQGDPRLRQYDTLIIDEAHERSLNIDFLLGYVKRLIDRRERPDLRLVVTSATIDAGRFSRHFGDAPVIEVSGRLYPVEVRYHAAGDEEAERDDEPDLYDAIVDAVDELAREGPGDVLVFLPGEREIREAADALRKDAARRGGAGRGGASDILPLYARLTAAEQDRVFRPHGGRRVVLATNVAETSLTVPGIRYVVDGGLARVKRYSYRNKVEQLRVEKISKASARQRAGRCGRVANGVCIRLYEEAEFERRPDYTDPEILRSSLAAVILRMKALGLGGIEDFPFIDPPPPRAVNDGYALLAELGALDDARALTETGRQLARLPVDPRLARMILAAKQEDAVAEVLVIAAALSVQDPRERPMERQAAADQKHARFDDEKSDFLAWLALWKWYGDARAAHPSRRSLAAHLHAELLSAVRLREWTDTHAQLVELAAEAGIHPGAHPADYPRVHRALLAGLLGNVGLKTEDGDFYLGGRGIRFLVHPASGVGRKAGRWVMAAEITETTRLYARCVARIEPGWIEAVGGHLLARSHTDPHWEKKPAQAMILERGTLYGIPVYAGRRVPWGPIDPKGARELFIREGLVAGELELRAPFFQHNQRLVREIEALEHKSRRPDVLVDDELLVAFYDREIPAEIWNLPAFETWRREVERTQPRRLFLSRAELMRHEAAGITTEAFPPNVEIDGRRYALDYRHEPGDPRDGVTMTVPLIALNQLNASACDWLVPGLLAEKVERLAKSLPQKLRHRLGPLPAFAAAFLATTPARRQPLTEAIVQYARRALNLALPVDGFRLETLPPYLAMNFVVVDEHGRQLGMGRSLVQLRAGLGAVAGQRFAEVAAAGAAAIAAELPAAAGTPDEVGERFTDWTFGPIEEIAEIRRGAESLIGYPALVDGADHVRLQVMDDPARAAIAYRAGLRRLFMLRLKDQARYLEKNIPGAQAMGLQFMAIGDAETLRPQLVTAAFDRTCMDAPLPRDRTAFDARCEQAKSRVTLVGQEIARLVATILAEHHGLAKKLASLAKAFPAQCRDVEAQVKGLAGPRFIEATPWERLQHFPRYLKAASARLDKMRVDPARDARNMNEIGPLLQGYVREVARIARSGATPDPQVEQFRWLLEELRVGLFTQELRTAVPVSSKRLAKLWGTIARS
jgi:ATP-dependent helicase HrpA